MDAAGKLWKGFSLTAKLLVHRPRGWKDYVLNGLSCLAGSGRSLGRPVHVTIEPATVCNLTCPVCETGAGCLERPRQLMSLDEYKAILGRLPDSVGAMMLYFMGETFLNPHAYDMIRLARERGIFVETCTNGDFVDPERLVDSGIDMVSFQMDGASAATHGTYRVGSDFERVVANLRRTVALRDKQGRRIPRITAGLIVMRHNVHEIETFRKKAMEEWGVDDVDIISPCVRTYAQGVEMIPDDDAFWLYDRKRFEEEHILRPRWTLPWYGCSWIYFSLTIQVNGDVVPCCRDPRGKHVLGNVFRQSVSEIWNSPRMRSLRRNIRQGRRPSLCDLCSGFGVPRVRWRS